MNNRHFEGPCYGGPLDGYRYTAPVKIVPLDVSGCPTDNRNSPLSGWYEWLDGEEYWQWMEWKPEDRPSMPAAGCDLSKASIADLVAELSRRFQPA